MSNLNSYNILINRFKAFADGHFLLKNFTYGAITLADLQKFGLYPFMHIVPVDVSYESGVKNFSFDVFFADLPRDEENKAEYQKETLSDLQQIAEDLLGEITNHRVIFGKDVSVISSRLVPFEEEFSNVLTGWNLSITLQIPYNWSACDIPATFNDFIVYNQSTGESSILEFKDSIVREGGEVRLVNDLEFPPASYYYGTDASGNRGWFVFPADEVGLTCETLGACDTIVDIQTNITNLENDVEDLTANVVQVQTDLTTLEESLSPVATSGDYNDLNNLPTIPDSTSDLINDSGFITINDVPTFVSVVAHEVKLGSTMTKGTPVYVSSADGTNMIVSPASNGSEATSSKTLGLLMEGGNTNAKVQVITEGLLDGLDTSTATIGDAVWLGSTGTLIYGLANKPVAPLHLVFIGIVTRVNTNNGEIFVKVQNGFELQEIHNVLIESVADNQVLQYESATSLWKNKTLATGLAVGTTPITNGGVGRILFEGTGNVLQESANLFWDNTNGRLGVGNTTPITSIDAKGSIRSTGSISTTRSIEMLYDESIGSMIRTNVYALIHLIADTTKLATFQSNGILFPANSSKLIGNTNRNLVEVYNESTGKLTAKTTGAWNLELGTNDIIRQTIFGSTGNVGINTTTDAGFKLDVNGSARVVGQLTMNNNIIIPNGTGAGVFSNFFQSNSTPFQFGTTYLFSSGAITSALVTSGSRTSFIDVITWTQTSGNADFSSFRATPIINQTGTANGITRGLYVNPTLTSATDFRAIETTAGNVLFGSNFFWDNTNSRLGIGTASPSQNIHISGATSPSLYIQETSGFTAARLITSSTFVISPLVDLATYSGISATNNGIFVGGGYFGVSGYNSIRFFTTASERMRLFNNGNFAIGTTTDAGFKLDVNGTARVSGTIVLGRINFTSNDNDGQLRLVAGTVVYNPTGAASQTSTSACFEFQGTTRGVLFPRLTTTQKNAIASAVAGLVVYDTTTNKLCCYNGTTWNDLF